MDEVDAGVTVFGEILKCTCDLIHLTGILFRYAVHFDQRVENGDRHVALFYLLGHPLEQNIVYLHVALALGHLEREFRLGR
jgi:hypothetical protein